LIGIAENQENTPFFIALFSHAVVYF